MIVFHLSAITLALLIDAIVGDPPRWPHPVRWIGRLIRFLDNRMNQGKFQLHKGVVMLFFVILVVGSVTTLIVWFMYHINPYMGILAEAILISTTLAQKSLKQAALEVYTPLRQTDMNKARRKLSYIVGRDTETLGEAEITRGAVETVAENTCDGITAPMFWALVGGAPFAMIYRAVNTCDSMVGYRNEKYHRFGWCSARMDDLLNWIPSRLTGFIMLICNTPKHYGRSKAWKILIQDAKKHHSPNSGWGEAGVAALLGVQLGGTNVYQGEQSMRSFIGRPTVPLEKNHILDTNTIMRNTVFGYICTLWIGGILFEVAVSWF